MGLIFQLLRTTTKMFIRRVYFNRIGTS